MKSKPVVMEHFSTIHTSFIVDFTFTNNLTILMGDSGTGKTATTSFIRESMAINYNQFSIFLTYDIFNIFLIIQIIETQNLGIDSHTFSNKRVCIQ